MRRKASVGSWFGSAAAVMWAVVVLAPLYFLVLGSFRSQGAYLTANPWLPLGGLTIANYGAAVRGIGVALRNSVLVTVSVCALVVLVSVPAAYAVVRGRGRAPRVAYWLFLAGLAVPLEGTIVAIFVIVVQFHLYNTLVGIILPVGSFSVAIAILILVAFLRDIPRELFEAMQVDGAGQLRLLRSLVFPMSRPALLGIGVFVALNSWNSLLLPLVTTTSRAESVLPVALLRLESSNAADYPAILASVVLSALPIVLLYLLGRRHLINGLVIGVGGR